MTVERPVCAWLGMMPDGEHMEPCGKPAHYYIDAPEKHRIYSCAEHLDHAKAQIGSGASIHMVPAYRASDQPGEFTSFA